MNNEFQRSNNNNGNTVKTVIITLLVAVLLFCIGFIIYDKVISKNNDTNNEENNNSNNSNDVVILDINSSQVQNLTAFVRSFNGGRPGGTDFLEKALSLGNTNRNDSMMEFISTLLSPTKVCSDPTSAGWPGSDCDNKCLVIDDTYYCGYVDQKNMENKFREVFGPDVSYTNRTINGVGLCQNADTYDSKTKKYWATYSCGGGDPAFVYSELYKAEQKDDEIYTYWYFYKHGFDGETSFYWSVIDVNGVEHKIPSDGIDSIDKIIEAANKLKAEAELKTYKITYKKQSDGNYYIYSGEWI